MNGKFALRCGDWVIWNYGPWQDGWISLDVLNTRTQTGVRRSIYRIGWNGSRFAACTEFDRLERRYGDPNGLAEFLRSSLQPVEA